MKVTYIDHSSFLIELENIVLLFDYFKGTIPSLPKSKQLFVFSSHSHHDHFNPDIFSLSGEYENVTYILSKDIESMLADNNNSNYNSIKNQIFYMDIHEHKCFVSSDNSSTIVTNNSNEVNENTLVVDTLESTDLGVAFIVTYNDKVIYHAGDLNWWSWEGETQAEYIEMTSKFKKEIDRIKGFSFDVAFVPLDPRQEGRFWWGLDHFMRETNTSVVFPMHLWGEYDTIPKLKELDRAKNYASKVISVTEEQQEFTI